MTPQPDQHEDRDEATGIETTGHEWDGLKELNLPAPRWWVIVFFLTVIWGVGYMIVYPAWPTLSGSGERGGTPGTFGWTQYNQLSASQQEIRARRSRYLADFRSADYNAIIGDPALYAFAVSGGASAFKDNCATCHGTGGAGAPGYPNLNDDAWLWGGTHAAIETSIRYGVRADHDETRYSEMPAFGDILSDGEVTAIRDHVLFLSGRAASGEQGATLYLEQCSVCHGEAGLGNDDLGAPNLADALWLYGGTPEDIAAQIRAPKHGLMPAWAGRLSDDTIRQLTVYVHSLGGGERVSAAADSENGEAR